MTALGHVLGVNYRSIAVYSEAIIRSNIIFHLSNLLERANCYISDKLKLPPYMVVSNGSAAGVVKFAKSCETFMQDSEKDKDLKAVIAFVEDVQGDEEFPEKVKGMIMRREIPLLSHLAIRIRQSGAACCACKSPAFYKELKALVKENQQYQLVVSPERVDLKPIHSHLTDSQIKKSESVLSSIEQAPVDFSVKFLITSSAEAQKQSSCIGTKSHNAFVLEGLAEKTKKFKTPKSCCIPYGALGNILKVATSAEEYMPISGVFAQLDCAEDGQVLEKFHSLLLEQINIKLEQDFSKKVVDEYAVQVKGQFGSSSSRLLAIRSSSNMEDLKKLSGAGLFDSILNIPSGDEIAICDAIKGVWKSLYSRRAVQSRIKYRLKQEMAAMAVLIQEMIPADYSFIIHTSNPITQNKDEVSIELAAGLGEVLASAVEEGNPYRLIYNKKTKKVDILEFANFSFSIQADLSSSISDELQTILDKGKRCRIDYTEIDYSTDEDTLLAIGGRLGEIAMIIESHYNASQDIEGAIHGEEVYIVQSRPQI